MRFVPSVFDDDYDLFADVFDDDFWPFNRNNSFMRTDVEEKDGKYIMKIELPGFDKNDIRMSLNNGVLNIAAKHYINNDETDERGNVIRSERYNGQMSRSFYVGKDVRQSDIRAAYKNGILCVEIPDHKVIEAEPEQRYIDID